MNMAPSSHEPCRSGSPLTSSCDVVAAGPRDRIASRARFWHGGSGGSRAEARGANHPSGTGRQGTGTASADDAVQGCRSQPPTGRVPMLAGSGNGASPAEAGLHFRPWAAFPPGAVRDGHWLPARRLEGAAADPRQDGGHLQGALPGDFMSELQMGPTGNLRGKPWNWSLPACVPGPPLSRCQRGVGRSRDGGPWEMAPADRGAPAA